MILKKISDQAIVELFTFQAATIAGADAPLVETAFLYGKNLGLAFQFVDDLLDFVSSSETMGKPAAADLKLGLATAPVLFACEKVFFLTFHFKKPVNLMIISLIVSRIESYDNETI